MKDIIMMSIYGRHNRCNVSMYDSNTYKGLKSSVIEVDANLYRDLSVEFGLIRMALGMIRSVETVAFKNVGTMLQSKKVTVTTHYEGYSSDITMYMLQEIYYVNQVHYDDYVLCVEVSLDRYNQFRVAMDTSYTAMLEYMRHILQSVLETISSYMGREGRYVRGVYGIWGIHVGTKLSILHKQILDSNDMLVFYKDGVHYNYYDVVDTYGIVRIPIKVFQKRMMLNTVIQLQSIKDTVYDYVDGILDTVYNS